MYICRRVTMKNEGYGEADAKLTDMLNRGDFQHIFEESQVVTALLMERTGEEEGVLADIVDAYAVENYEEALKMVFKRGVILGLVLQNEGRRNHARR
jgi:hypothetical protein